MKASIFKSKIFFESSELKLNQVFKTEKNIEEEIEIDSDIDDGIPCNYKKPDPILKGPQLKYKELVFPASLNIEDIEVGIDNVDKTDNNQAEKAYKDKERIEERAQEVASNTDKLILNTNKDRVDSIPKNYILMTLASHKGSL